MPLVASEPSVAAYRKFAVTDVSLVMVTVVGLAVPVPKVKANSRASQVVGRDVPFVLLCFM